MPIDTVYREGADSLGQGVDSTGLWVDSLALFPVDTLPAPTPVSVGDVFGPASRLETQSIHALPHALPAKRQLDTLLLDGLTVGLLLLFLYRLIRFRTSTGVLFRALFVPGQFDALQENQSVAFRQFIRISYRISVWALLVIGFKWCLLWAGSPHSAGLPEMWRPWLLAILFGTGIAVWIYKRTVMGIISILAGSRALTDKIHHFNNFYMAVASHGLAPIAILSALVDPGQVRWIFVVQLIVLIILLLYYITKSFSFFLSRNIPLLQWFLYLCAVEIWPFSFFALFALRGFVW